MSAIAEPTAAVAAEALTWPDRARALTITSDESYRAAAEMLKGIKALRAKVVDTFGPLKVKAHAAWKAIVAEQDKADAPLTEAESLIKRAMVTYDQAQEAKRREEARRLAEEARKAEEVRRLAEAAAMEREAVATQDAALLAEAEALISEPVEAPVVILPKNTPKVEGVSYREVWKFEITDANAIPREYLIPDMTRIGQVVRAMKGSTRIAGIRAYPERSLAAGGGK